MPSPQFFLKTEKKKPAFETSIFHEIINLRPHLFKMREFEDMPDY